MLLFVAFKIIFIFCEIPTGCLQIIKHAILAAAASYAALLAEQRRNEDPRSAILNLCKCFYTFTTIANFLGKNGETL